MLEKVLAERFPKLPNKMKYHVIGAAFAPTFEARARFKTSAFAGLVWQEVFPRKQRFQPQ